MLCTAHWINKYVGDIPRKLESDEWNKVKEQKQNEPRDYPYLPTMHNHPCSIWVRESLDNYEWLYNLAYELNEEYGHRYGKSHKSMHDVIAKLPDIGSHHLLKLCQTNSKAQTQSKPTEDFTTKIKQPSQIGQKETNHTGGMKKKPVIQPE